MRRIWLQPAGSDAAVEVRIDSLAEDQPDRFAVHWGDNQADVACRMAGSGEGVMTLHGHNHPFYAIRRGPHLQLWLGGTVHRYEILDRTARRSAEGATAQAAETVTAPMPGSIIEIHVAAGEPFEAHQALIIMESMKMEMTLSMPQPGTIKEITCEIGQLVEAGATLAHIEDIDTHDTAAQQD